MLTLLNEIKPSHIHSVSTGFYGAGPVCNNSTFLILSGVRGAVQTVAVSSDSRQQNLESLIQLFWTADKEDDATLLTLQMILMYYEKNRNYFN